MKVKALALLILAAVITGWQYASTSGAVPRVLLPAPGDIAVYLWDATLSGDIPEAVLVTLRRLLLGYGMGLCIGLFLGFLLYTSALARTTIGPLALGLQTLPSVCWAPLSLLWFGQTESAMYFVVIMGSIWAIAIATENALKMVPASYIQAARVMGSKGAHTWRTVIFPAALPQLTAGAKLGWAFSWRSLMAAEIYVTIITSLGLGQLLHFGRELHAMDQTIGVMAVIVFIGLLADYAVFRPIEDRMRRNRGI